MAVVATATRLAVCVLFAGALALFDFDRALAVFCPLRAVVVCFLLVEPLVLVKANSDDPSSSETATQANVFIRKAKKAAEQTGTDQSFCLIGKLAVKL
jgi:hypothetical protein